MKLKCRVCDTVFDNTDAVLPGYINALAYDHALVHKKEDDMHELFKKYYQKTGDKN